MQALPSCCIGQYVSVVIRFVQIQPLFRQVIQFERNITTQTFM